MPIPPESMIMERFQQQEAEIHNLQVSTDRSVIVFDATYAGREGKVHDLPALFMMMCVSGGGAIKLKTTTHDFEGEIGAGDIGIAAPSSPGYGVWPDMRVIGFGIEVKALSKSLGDAWPKYLRKDVLSSSFRDPMVEATMMQIGYTHAGRISDSVLLHAAHMVVHQLLDTPHEATPEPDKAAVQPLPETKIKDIHAYVLERVENTISVDELSRHVGISRHHFSRRFRAATGRSPYQYILDIKLDHAASTMNQDSGIRIIDVANMVGYQNAAQFAEAFRRRFGLTPRRWRLRGD